MRTHGHTWEGGKSPTYHAWQNMIARCTLPSNPAFKHYKKRGIKVCKRWSKFVTFLADMGVRPSGKRRYTLERIDNDGNYEPNNCRWATWREQGNNRITNILFWYKGKQFTLANLARETGVGKELLRSRLCRGKGGAWTVETAVSTPKRRGHRTDILGSMMSHA